MTERMKGQVCKVERGRGYAFVWDEDGFRRMIHINDFENSAEFETLKENDPVDFIPSDKGTKGNGLLGLRVRRCSK